MLMMIAHACLATLGDDPQLVRDGALLVTDGFITDLGTTAELAARYPGVACWDAAGQMVLPASICAHTHFYGAFARGWAYPGPPISPRFWRISGGDWIKYSRWRTCVTRLWFAWWMRSVTARRH